MRANCSFIFSSFLFLSFLSILFFLAKVKELKKKVILVSGVDMGSRKESCLITEAGLSLKESGKMVRVIKTWGGVFSGEGRMSGAGGVCKHL